MYPSIIPPALYCLISMSSFWWHWSTLMYVNLMKDPVGHNTLSHILNQQAIEKLCWQAPHKMECSSPPLFWIFSTRYIWKEFASQSVMVLYCWTLVYVALFWLRPSSPTLSPRHSFQKTHSCHYRLYADYDKPYTYLLRALCCPSHWSKSMIAIFSLLQIHFQGITVLNKCNRMKWSHSHIGSPSSSSRLAQDKPTFAVR